MALAVIYTVMSLLTHMMVVDLTHTTEHWLGAVLVHWVAREMVHWQEDSMVQMVTHIVMSLQAGKLVQAAPEIYTAMYHLLEDVHELVDLMGQNVAV